ncbi:MAG: dockerin type I domain-containing protein [Sodaliphilus sp.]
MKAILRLLAMAVVAICVPFGAMAETYLIDAAATQSGATITYRNINFTVGTTAFASFAEFNAANPKSSSTLYVAPGTYEGGAIALYNLKVMGANAFRHWSDRTEETTITSPIYINAGSVEVNGFAFTGAGRVIANTATNEAPLYSIRVRYNIFSNSTVSRAEGTSLISIGSRYADANANSDVSQRRYANCAVEHNRFNGGGSHLANSIGLFGVFGTTSVTDNYIYDGGTGVHICNAQGNINVKNNKFLYVGVTAAANTDGGGVGAFSVYYERSAYANTSTLNITDNEFDHCYGKTSYMALLRVYPGTAGSTSCVTPSNLSVNINRNTFTNKTSTATNSGQLGENMLLYADKGTTGGVKFNIADNHYDNRFYKFSFVTLADSWGQREIYSNVADQFTLAGKYSTMGTSIIDGKDISNHLTGLTPANNTVIQSMDIDPVTGDLYFLQLMNSTNKSNFNSANGLSTTECDPLYLFRVPCTKKATATDGTYTYSTSIQKMSLAKTGHGVKLCVFRDPNGQLWMVTGAKGSDNGTSNDLSGKAICKFKFVSGATVIADGRTNSTVSLSYYDHPKGYTNVYADIDPVNRYICYSSSGSGKRRYCVYDLDAFLAGNNVEIKEYVMTKGDTPVTGSGLSGDAGFEWKSYQSFCISGDYLYIYEGVGSSSNSPVHIMNIVNWRTNTFIQRKDIDYARINNMSWGEPEAMAVRPDVFGNACMYLGISANSSSVSVLKFHIDRHVNSSGTVIGDDTNATAKHFSTSQYSGITMAPSASEMAFTAGSIEETPSQTLTVNRTSEYMFGKWTAVISGEDGDVFSAEVADHNQFASAFTVNVTFRPDGRETAYSAQLRLTSPNATDIVIPLSATAPAATVPGDVNCDGKVDVSDVTALVSKILGEEPDSFNPAAADLNADTLLDVSDVTALVTLILT